MSNYSERSLRLAAELRRQALHNLENTKQTAPETSRSDHGRREARKSQK